MSPVRQLNPLHCLSFVFQNFAASNKFAFLQDDEEAAAAAAAANESGQDESE